MRLLIDTNVILDYLLNNPGFGDDANEIFALSTEVETYEFVSSSAITDIFYVARKAWHNSFAAQQVISDLMDFLTILEVGKEDIEMALSLHWKDFEDAVQYAVALSNNVDFIISRNSKDFESQVIPVLTPKEFLNSIGES